MSDSSPAESAERTAGGTVLAAPRWGTATTTWLLVWSSALALTTPTATALVQSVRGQLWQGAMWGAVSVASWILVYPPARWLRRLAAVVVIAILCGWFQLSSGRPAVRYVVAFGSFALLQAAVATVGGWPGWSCGQQPLEQTARYRFGIAGVMALTMGVAVVLASGRLYEPAERLFFNSQIASVGLVSIALCGQRTLAMRHGGSRWAWAMLGSWIATSFLLGALHVWQEQQVSLAALLRTLPGPASRQAVYYAFPLLSFVAVVCGTAVCGRLDHERERGLRRARRQLTSPSPDEA